MDRDDCSDNFIRRKKDIMKIVKSLKSSGLLRKDVSETNENKAGAKDKFLSILMATLGASLLGNILVGEGTIRAGQDF